jgi:hypothetical protein
MSNKALSKYFHEATKRKIKGTIRKLKKRIKIKCHLNKIIKINKSIMINNFNYYYKKNIKLEISMKYFSIIIKLKFKFDFLYEFYSYFKINYFSIIS